MNQKEIRSYLCFTLGALDVTLLDVETCEDLGAMLDIVGSQVLEQRHLLERRWQQTRCSSERRDDDDSI